MTDPSERYALLVIDMQRDFVLPGGPLEVPGAMRTVPAIKMILDFFRLKSWPVFFIMREHRADASDVEAIRLDFFVRSGGYAVKGSRGCEVIEQLEPREEEYRIVKRRFSAFFKTELELLLRRLGIEHVVVCGTQYPTCVRTSVFDAVALDFRVTVLTDATSARTEEIAAVNIRDMRDIGVECVPVSEFISSVSP